MHSPSLFPLIICAFLPLSNLFFNTRLWLPFTQCILHYTFNLHIIVLNITSNLFFRKVDLLPQKFSAGRGELLFESKPYVREWMRLIPTFRDELWFGCSLAEVEKQTSSVDSEPCGPRLRGQQMLRLPTAGIETIFRQIIKVVRWKLLKIVNLKGKA